ncbi:MAG: hypothetical protein ACUVRZ_03145 [Desulfobacca sp.]|uniref:hypothetical protein n=1 Tax=Desulfobacca sp. TaxID=2067990 RepID=UPI00404B75FB
MEHPLHQPVTTLIYRAIELMDGLLRDRLDVETYARQLRELEVDGLMETYKEDFQRDASLVYYLDALMLLSSLQHELEFQVAEYGRNAATEDIKILRELLQKFPAEAALPRPAGRCRQSKGDNA